LDPFLRRLRPQSKQATKSQPLRRVVGSPIVWKELRAPLIIGGRRHTQIGLTIAVLVQLGLYALYYRGRILHMGYAHMTTVMVFLIFGLFVALVMSATTLTSEKESQNWPILLSTCLTEGQILWGKALGMVRRCLVIWMFLIGHLILFTALGYIHPAALLHMGLIVGWLVVFLTGTGLFLGTCFRRTTSAVVANLVLALLIWLAVPGLTVAVSMLRGRPGKKADLMLFSNPLVQTVQVLEASAGQDKAHVAWQRLNYRTPTGGRIPLARMMQWQGSWAVFYSATGLLLAEWARRRIRSRRNIF
jgi:ABC-type transport system involved in multi-copper enzyme maturation permease subunit